MTWSSGWATSATRSARPAPPSTTRCGDATAELKPDGIELQFGVKLGGEMGVPFVAKGTSEASFSIKLTWAPDNV